ncbi:F-box protein [Striga asiatica]|uniref:F-box protein n=1 Tax=Striga asiatica TaxID=4170 RepID=A0A5A7RGK3_STRAF|nr:F-box protein [Striga asiatica]
MATNLPFELVEDILRRLPVKSLKRFRSVARSWHSLIDSEPFAKSHLHRSLSTASNRHLLIGLELLAVDLGRLDRAVPLRPPFCYRASDGFSNSCNGVVLAMGDPPVLYNPFSRDHRVLPSCPIEHRTPPECYPHTVYGFGYEPIADDYKVIRVIEFRHEGSYAWVSSEARVYSLRSNCWRRIEDFPYPLPFLNCFWRVHVSGSLHTLVLDPRESDGGKIMAFSVQTEKHSSMKLPPGVQMWDSHVVLYVLDSCLSVVHRKKYSKIDIWVMKEYGSSESWTKVVAVGPPAIDRLDFLSPLVYSPDGDKVLLSCNDFKLVWFDSKEKSVSDVNVQGLPYRFYAEVCVESLIRLSEQGKETKKKIRRKREKKGKKR